MNTMFDVLSASEWEELNENRLCGECGNYSVQHPISNSESFCTRRFHKRAVHYVADGLLSAYLNDPSKFPYGLQYETDAYGAPYVSEMGDNEVDREDQYQDEFYRYCWVGLPGAPNILDKTTKDDMPNECSVTIEQYREGYRAGKIQERRLTKNIEPLPEKDEVWLGGTNYKVELLIDPNKTEGYQMRKLMNAYTDKQGFRRVGSVKFIENTDNTITVECVKCNVRSNFNFENHKDDPELLRDAMEEFTLSLIRHGNNHAAYWLRSRASWYKIHEVGCDYTCNEYDAHCRKPKVNPRALLNND